MTPKKVEVKKTELLKFRVTPAEKSTVVTNATKSGDTVSDYIKSRIGLEKTEEKKEEEKKPS